jgi:molybdopterin-guanine dinucleotide biosynthesis protein B
MIPVLGFVGYSNSGKTTVVAKLTGILTEMGYQVAVIKHASHGYEMDIPGKDSWQHYQAGAQQVIVVGPDSMSVHERTPNEKALGDVLRKVNNVDFILVEGFKNESGPKIEIVRDPNSPRIPASPDMIAVISDLPLHADVPIFRLDQLQAAAIFIIEYFKFRFQ